MFQFVEFLTNDSVVIELWGRQADDGGSGDLSTTELMLKDKSSGGGARGNVGIVFGK